jgi:hypothetical protein
MSTNTRSYRIRAYPNGAQRRLLDRCVDAGDACPEEIPEQVLAEEARSGQRNRACLEQARFG